MIHDYEMTWGMALTRSARQYPGKVAVQDDHGRLTYDQFNRRVNRLAHALIGFGLTAGDRMATLSTNCLSLMELYFAALKTGIVPCPLDVRGTVSDQEGELSIVQPTLLACHPAHQERMEQLRSGLPRQIPLIVFGEAGEEMGGRLGDLFRCASEKEPAFPIAEGDTAFILFTGGTTGIPKGVMLSHRNLIWNAVNVISENGSPAPDSRIYYPMQIYHSGALSRFLASIYAGGTFIATSAFDPGQYLDMVERERCTFAVGNTAIWNLLLEESRKKTRDIRSVTSWLHAQGDINPEFRDEIRGCLFPNGRMYASYALSEASPGVTVLKPGDQPRRWPGIGRPYMSLEVRIADDADQEVAVGEAGQILVRGPNVMKGYFRNPSETATALAGGWLHTGDVGCTDDLGFLYFVDRLKDVIKTGGINVYSREVEEVIMTHPHVMDAAVIGVPDRRWGETIRAVVVSEAGHTTTEEEVIAYCKAKLASHKKPTSVVFVEELPRGSFGSKILKKLLREKYGQP